MDKKIIIICSSCGKEVEKKLAEIKRQKKKGRKVFYCSLGCAGKANCSHLEKYFNQQSIERIKKYRRKLDDYSNFRWYMKCIKNRQKDSNIDMFYLKQLWEAQIGMCPITKKELTLRTHSECKINKITPYHASLDRIDNTKGYIKDNVRFVALIFNYARNIFSDKQVIEFCEHVTNNQKGSI
jgi:hypothetical protein